MKQQLLLATALFGIGAGPVYAQGNASGQAGSIQLEEVVVTAEHRQGDVQKVAQSVSVRSGAELAQEGKFTLRQILEDVPGVSGGASTGTGGGGSDNAANGITIRGIGANTPPPNSTTSVVSAVAPYVDGVPNGVGGTYDLDRIEILRGPQGTLYGRSATAGVLAIHTRDPQLDQWNGYVSAEVASYDLRHVSGAVNVPLGDKAALRVSANTYRRDGYYAEGGGAYQVGGASLDTQNLRVKLLVEPTPALSILAGYSYEHNKTHTGQHVGVLTGQGQVNYDATAPLGTGKDQFNQVWAQVDLNLGSLTLTYLPALRTWTQDATIYTGTQFLSIKEIFDTPHDYFHTQELRLASDETSKLKWQTGLFYYNNALKTHGIQWQGVGYPLRFDAYTDKDTTNVGAYGEATYALTDTLRVTGGVRYDHTKVQVTERYVTGTGAVFNLNPSNGGRQTTDNSSFKARVEKDLSPSALVYASVSSAFLPGDITITQINGVPKLNSYTAETLTSYELGSKNRFLDDSLQINGNLYYSEYGGFQVSNINVNTPTSPSYMTLTSPARVWGGELEVQWRATPADRFGFTAAYTNGRYVNPSALFSQYVANKQMVGFSPWNVNASYGHTFTLSGGQTLRLGGNVLYRSQYQYQTSTPAQWAAGNQIYVRVKPGITENLEATWDSGKGLSLTAYVRNASDNRYVPNPVFVVKPPGLSFGDWSEPRTFGVTANYNF